MLRQHVGRIAAAGRLRVREEQAASLFHAAAVGVVRHLLNLPADLRDMTTSHMARDASLAIIADAPSPPSSASPQATAAITLRAALSRDSPFSTGELSLLREWLDRLVKLPIIPERSTRISKP
jgi:hypothetical protein